jgi:hypothetical protein
MSKLLRKWSKSKVSRVAISKVHARNIEKMRSGSTALRRRFIEDMSFHKFSPATSERYLSAAIHFCAYFWKAPSRITDDEIRLYLNGNIVVMREYCEY